jgi:hypothetical protein
VVFAAPEFVEAEPIEVRRKIEIALEQQRRVLPGGVVGGEERTEADPSHRRILRIAVRRSPTEVVAAILVGAVR